MSDEVHGRRRAWRWVGLLALLLLAQGAGAELRVVITNDDGVKDLESRVLPLAEKLRDFADVFVVVPWVDRSGSTHFASVTRSDRLEVETWRSEKGKKGRGRLEVYVVRGYPADCVLLAVGGLLEEKPDLILSGINGSPNLADSWLYSGTIGAARMAAHHGFPAVAVSGIDEDGIEEAIGPVASWVAALARSPAVLSMQRGVYLTVAMPPIAPSGIVGVGVAPHDSHVSPFRFAADGEKLGRDVWKLVGDNVATAEAGTDLDLVRRGLISITPMRVGGADGSLLADWRARLPELPAWPPSSE